MLLVFLDWLSLGKGKNLWKTFNTRLIDYREEVKNLEFVWCLFGTFKTQRYGIRCVSGHFCCQVLITFSLSLPPALSFSIASFVGTVMGINTPLKVLYYGLLASITGGFVFPFHDTKKNRIYIFVFHLYSFLMFFVPPIGLLFVSCQYASLRVRKHACTYVLTSTYVHMYIHVQLFMSTPVCISFTYVHCVYTWTWSGQL